MRTPDTDSTCPSRDVRDMIGLDGAQHLVDGLIVAAQLLQASSDVRASDARAAVSRALRDAQFMLDLMAGDYEYAEVCF